ncbi:hypothetical protein BESB_065860 [Besnoitia besnoiti]|uniref:Uncharacterized protein n=1 Tax=Besnoitia besnoiti TaxID=94643 RepID=A0A2A9MFW2_BESBE|nr:hypothetical protein BESB_065860 [Besnoitia besnoiti]PFH34553.1 hypothetical protein BESB_065860 [Besnoitia besnoiti]
MPFASDVSKMMLAARPSPAARLGVAQGGGNFALRLQGGAAPSASALLPASHAGSSDHHATLPKQAAQVSFRHGAAPAAQLSAAGGKTGANFLTAVAAGAAAGAKGGVPGVPALEGAQVGGAKDGGMAGGSCAGATTMTALFRGQQTGVGFLLNKLVEVLKKDAGRSFHVKEVEKILIQAGFSGIHLFFQPNSEFLKLLSSNERIAYNPRTRTLAFHNPYQAITSCSALLAKIQHEGALTGLKVDAELLCAHAEMTNWINTLLASRKVRAIRCNNNHLRGKRKCAAIGSTALGVAPNTAAVCDIYAARKCANCRQNLCGVYLYPLGEEVYEQARMDLDAEVKGLWDSVVLPPLEDIIKECDPGRTMVRQNAAAAAQEKTQLKRRAEAKRVSRFRSKFRRIHNTHLFTADELRAFTNAQAPQ